MKILTPGDILGLFEERFQKFGYMYIIGDQRTAMVHDFSVERSYAEIILFYCPEANSMLFREFLP